MRIRVRSSLLVIALWTVATAARAQSQVWNVLTGTYQSGGYSTGFSPAVAGHYFRYNDSQLVLFKSHAGYDGGWAGSTPCSSSAENGLVASDAARKRMFWACNDSWTVYGLNESTGQILGSLYIDSQTDLLLLDPTTGYVWVHPIGSNAAVRINTTTWTFTNFALGSGSHSFALNTSNGKLYATNSSSNTVTIINSAGTVTTRSVVSTPGFVTVSPISGKAWVASSANGTATILSGADAVITSPTVGAGGAVDIGYDSVSDRAYVLCGGSSAVLSSINGSTNAVTWIDVSAYGTPGRMLVDPARNRVWFTGSSQVKLLALDVASGVITESSVQDRPPYPYSVDPLSGSVFAVQQQGCGFLGCSSGTSVYGFEKAPSTVVVGDFPVATAVDARLRRLYVVNQLANSLSILDADSQAGVATVGFGSGSSTAVATNDFTHRVYVADTGGDRLRVVDGTSNLVIASPVVGDAPKVVVTHPGFDRIFVASSTDGTVSILDGSTSSVLQTVATGIAGYRKASMDFARNRLWLLPSSNQVVWMNVLTGEWAAVAVGSTPEDILVDPVENKLFVSNGGSNSVSVIDLASATVSATITGVTSHPTVLAKLPWAGTVLVGTKDPYSNRYRIHQFDATTHVLGSDWASLDTETIEIVVDSRLEECSVLTAAPAGGGGRSLSLIQPWTPGASGLVMGSWTVGSTARGLAVDLATGTTFGANPGNDTVFVRKGNGPSAVPLTTTMSPSGSITTDNTPTFTLTATSSYSPAQTTRLVSLQVDAFDFFLPASFSGSSWGVTTAALSLGPHAIYAFAADGQYAASSGNHSTSVVGKVAFDEVFIQPTCGSPAITAQPTGVTVCAGGTILLSANGTGTAPISYVWKRNGIPLGNGGGVSGANATTLTITGATTGDAGSYTFWTYDLCGNSISSSAVSVSVTPPPGEAQLLGLTKDGSGRPVLSWSAPASGGAGVTYDVIRTGLPSDFVSPLFAYCVSVGQGALSFTDTVPSPYAVDYYLIRPKSSCGLGAAGTNSDGQTIAVRSCP